MTGLTLALGSYQSDEENPGDCRFPGDVVCCVVPKVGRNDAIYSRNMANFIALHRMHRVVNDKHDVVQIWFSPYRHDENCQSTFIPPRNLIMENGDTEIRSSCTFST